ncbi:MAG: lysophospholipid acyltransferase family protein [Gammaproteobacteria bacterium]|nr:lysophospholipid acyltransferase family protein [Gammaproteobacteria bacterium]
MSFLKRFTLYLITLWVIIRSFYYTAMVGIRTASRAYFGTVSRRWVDNTLHVWTDKVLKLANVHYKIVNPHAVSPPFKRPIILMCNHSSMYDIPLSFLVFPSVSLRMLAKKELFSVPTMGMGMRASEFPGIDRHNRQQAIKDLQQVKGLLESGIVLWIAPEGTRTKDGKLGVFKKGGFITAIETQALIIPMGIRGAHAILPAGTFQLQLNQNVEIHIGEPVDAADYTVSERDKLVKVVRDKMLALVGEV